MTGFNISSSTARRWELLDHVFDSPRELETYTNSFAELLLNNAPTAMRAQKRLIRFCEENDLVSGVDAGVDAFAAAYADGGIEPKQYIAKFRASRALQKEMKDIQEKVWVEHPETPGEPVEDFSYTRSVSDRVPKHGSIDEVAPSSNNSSWKPWKSGR